MLQGGTDPSWRVGYVIVVAGVHVAAVAGVLLLMHVDAVAGVLLLMHVAECR